MTKHEFLQRLEAGLQTVPAEERVAAVQYYTEYLDDAGPEHEGEVIAEIGSPEQLAADIRAESGTAAPADDAARLGLGGAPTAPSHAGYTDPEAYAEGQRMAQGLMRRTQFGPGFEGYTGQPNRPPHQAVAGGGMDIVRALLLAALVLLSPAIFGVLVAVFTVLVVFSLIPWILCVAFGGTGVLCIILGFTLLPITFPNAFVVLGLGVLFAALAAMLGYAGFKAITSGVRSAIGIVRSAVRGIGNLFSKKEATYNG